VKAKIVITVKRNINTPKFTTTRYTKDIPYNKVIGTSVLTVTATDADIKVSYIGSSHHKNKSYVPTVISNRVEMALNRNEWLNPN
jgi:hypothetical protein